MKQVIFLLFLSITLSNNTSLADAEACAKTFQCCTGTMDCGNNEKYKKVSEYDLKICTKDYKLCLDGLRGKQNESRKYCTQITAGAGGNGVVCCNDLEYGKCGATLTNCGGEIVSVVCTHNVYEVTK